MNEPHEQTEQSPMNPEPEVEPTAAELIEAARIRRGWTQAELSRRSGVAPPEVNRILRGKRKLNSTRLMDGIARALATTPREEDPVPDYGGWLGLLMQASNR